MSDWDTTLMDGLEDEPPFFTDEEIENILQEEPTIEEESRNFSTITPNSENIFQQEYVPSLSDEEIMEMNQDEYERKLDMEDDLVAEPTPEDVVEKYNLEESVKEYFEEKPEDPAIEILEDQLYEEVEESDEDDIKKKS